MTTITGLTAAAMTAIRNGVITGASINGSGHLILTKYDGSTLDAGNAKGATGATGATSPPSGAAGGSLGGTYPNPTLSAAYQAQIDDLVAMKTQTVAVAATNTAQNVPSATLSAIVSFSSFASGTFCTASAGGISVAEDGMYQFLCFMFGLSTNAAGQLNYQVQHMSGGAAVETLTVAEFANSLTPKEVTVPVIFQMLAGDYVRLAYTQNSGATLTMNTAHQLRGLRIA